MRDYWWEKLNQCFYINEKNKRCQNNCRKSFEIEKGNLFIPITCQKHQQFEEELRKKGKLNE